MMASISYITTHRANRCGYIRTTTYRYTMKIRLLALLLGICLALSAGCKSLPNRTETALLANQVLLQLLDVYKAQQNLCLNKPTEPEIDSCISEVRSNWSPIWTAFDRLNDAEDLKAAWCDFLGVLVAKKIDLPLLKDLQSAC